MDIDKAPVDVTENYIRIRVRDPGDFQKDSFRTIWISKSKGIKAIIARPHGKSTTQVQSYLFDKNKWTVKEAQDWVKKHKSEELSMLNKLFMTAKVDKMLNVGYPEEPIKASENGQFKEFDPTTRYKFEVAFVHEGKNQNGAIFTKDELFRSHLTPLYQYVDWEHDQSALLGAIADSKLIITPDSTQAINVTSVLWPMSPYLQFEGRLNRILKRFEEGNLYTSMECWFDDCVCAKCNYKALNMWDFYFHCQVEHPDEKIVDIGYVLNGVKFAGMGIVEFPADPEATVDKLVEGMLVELNKEDNASDNQMFTKEQIDYLNKHGYWPDTFSTETGITTGYKYVLIPKEKEDMSIDDNKQDIDEGVKWDRKYINDLEDDCFAVVEPGYPKETDNKNARHLPHHSKGHGNNSGSMKLDLPHYRNALARCNQIQPITKSISAEALRSKASKHLEAHRKMFEKEKGFLNYINGENMLKDKIKEDSTFEDIVNVYNEEVKKVTESQEITVESKVGMIVELANEFVELAKAKLVDFATKTEAIDKNFTEQLKNLSDKIRVEEEEIKNLKIENETLKSEVAKLTKEKEEKEVSLKIAKVFEDLSKDGVELTDAEKEPLEKTLKTLVGNEESFKAFVDSWIRAYKIGKNIDGRPIFTKTKDDKIISPLGHLEEVEQKYKPKKE